MQLQVYLKITKFSSVIGMAGRLKSSNLKNKRTSIRWHSWMLIKHEIAGKLENINVGSGDKVLRYCVVR